MIVAVVLRTFKLQIAIVIILLNVPIKMHPVFKIPWGAGKSRKNRNFTRTIHKKKKSDVNNTQILPTNLEFFSITILVFLSMITYYLEYFSSAHS